MVSEQIDIKPEDFTRDRTYPSASMWVTVEGAEGIEFAFHVNWLMSTYRCMYGNGCPGHFGEQNSFVRPDVGCCSNGTWIENPDEMRRVNGWVDQLTEEDMDADALAYVRRKGGFYVVHEADVLPADGGHDLDENVVDGEVVYACKCGLEFGPREHDAWEHYLRQSEGFKASSRVRQGACVFSNKAGGKAGKPGCALHHLATRLGERHTETKPRACYLMPLHVYEDENEDGQLRISIGPLPRYQWGGSDHDSWVRWWCVDAPEAYDSANPPVYLSYAEEIRTVVGDTVYAKLVEKMQALYPVRGSIEKMPAAGGRPLLPLIIGNRQPQRPDPNFERRLDEMREVGGGAAAGRDDA